MTIAVDLPPEIEEKLRIDWPDLERDALEAFVVEAYRQKRIGAYTVGALLGFGDRDETITFLTARSVYPNYDLDDLEDDRRSFEMLEKSGKL